MSKGSLIITSHSMFLPSNPNVTIKIILYYKRNTLILPVMNVDAKCVFEFGTPRIMYLRLSNPSDNKMYWLCPLFFIPVLPLISLLLANTIHYNYLLIDLSAYHHHVPRRIILHICQNNFYFSSNCLIFLLKIN